MEKMRDTMDFDSPPVLLKKQQPQQRPTKRKLPKVTCNYLTAVANKIENNHRLQGLRKVDKYGESSESPSNRPTTICGGVLSIIFFLIVLGLIVYNVFMLASQQRSITVGDRIHMNHVPDNFKIAGIIDVDGQSVHFPVLDMVIENKIFFYEADSPSIQKVRISDNTGYNPAYSTSYSVASPPTTRSVYSKFALPFDSVDDTTGKVPGRFKAFQVNSTELLIAQLPAQFDKNAQTIQLLESARNMIAGTYYPHSTSLYIRLLRRQIDEILDNQLDVSMINVAELESLTGSYLTRVGQSKTHVSSASAFSNITNLKAPFNSLILRSNLAESITGGGEDLNWNLKIQYSSNFNYTLTSFYCYDSDTGLLNNSTFTPLAFISPPISSDSTFTILDQSVATFMSSMNLDFPFEMLIWDRFQVEKVTVTGGDNSVFQVLRSGSLDFSASTDSSNCFFKQPHPFLSYLSAPAAWTCPRQYYNDKVCDCNCGAVDVDCAFCPQSPPSYCSISPPTPTTQEVGQAVAVSIACAGTQSVRVPANGIIRGFSGSETSAKQCPEDTFYYNGSAIALPNGTLACNARPAAQIVFDMAESIVYQALNPLVYDLDFPASLTIGISNFDVRASIQRKDNDLVVQINSGMPQTTQCGVRPNIPFSSTGYLRSPFQYDEKTFLYSPPDPSTYLPPGSPYNIHILGEQLTVASAACPRGEDNMQVVTLQSAPSPSLVDRLNLLTIYGYAASASMAGASQISVEPADGDSRSLSEYFCCFKELQISVGNDNMNSYVYEVTDIKSNTTNLDCCTNSCFDEIISLSLSSPLIAIAPQGIRVAAIRSFESPFPVNISASACTPENKNQTQVPVVMLSLLEAQPVSEASANIYYPNYRFLNFPVQDLDLELGMFIVPQKSGFDILSKLCPGREDVSSGGNSVWVIQSDRNITVNNCSLGVPDIDDVALCGLTNCTSPIILPTRQFTFSHKVPINQKWEQIPEQEIDQLNSPEYLIDVSTVYYFDYTGQDLAVGKRFASNIPQDGDYDQFYNKFKFSGEMDFIGKLQSDDPEISLFPANAPILDFTVNITADKNLTNKMIHKIGKKLGVNKAIGWSDKTVNKFNSWNISWPLTLPLTLQPGYNYTFKATVIMQPVFNVGILGGYTLVRWINSTSTTFEISTAEFSNSNRANIRIIVSFDPSATALLNQTDFTVFDFIAAVGSALALFQIGMSILTVWQKATLHTEEPYRPNPYAPKKIRRDIQLSTLGSSL